MSYLLHLAIVTPILTFFVLKAWSLHQKLSRLEEYSDIAKLWVLQEEPQNMRWRAAKGCPFAQDLDIIFSFFNRGVIGRTSLANNLQKAADRLNLLWHATFALVVGNSVLGVLSDALHSIIFGISIIILSFCMLVFSQKQEDMDNLQIRLKDVQDALCKISKVSR